MRPVYIAPELIDNELKRGEFKLPEGYVLIPCNYFFKVVLKQAIPDCKISPINIRFNGSPQNKYTAKIVQFVKTMLVRRALFEMQVGRNEKAKEIVKIYLEKFKGSRLPAVLNKLFK